MLMPLIIFSTQLALELIMFFCSFKLELQRSITKAVLALTVMFIVMDCFRLAKEVTAGEGFSEKNFSSLIMDTMVGATMLMVGLASVSSTLIELKLEQLVRILPERDHLNLTLV